MSTELICSISAVVISLAAFVMSGFVEYRHAIREKNQATLEEYNVLQEQAFDCINEYTQDETNDIVRTRKKAVIEKNKSIDPDCTFLDNSNIKELAKATGYDELTIRVGLQQGLLPFGAAIRSKNSPPYGTPFRAGITRHTNVYYPKKIEEYFGIHLTEAIRKKERVPS